MTDSTGTTSFTYDNANRQTAQTAPNGTTSYQYDAADRRTQMSVGTSAWTYVYDNVGRLTSETNPSNDSNGYASYWYLG